MRQTRGIYLISMVAETLDMHPQTLRKYERAGFVVPLRMGTLRTYSDEDVATAQVRSSTSLTAWGSILRGSKWPFR